MSTSSTEPTATEPVTADTILGRILDDPAASERLYEVVPEARQAGMLEMFRNRSLAELGEVSRRGAAWIDELVAALPPIPVAAEPAAPAAVDDVDPPNYATLAGVPLIALRDDGAAPERPIRHRRTFTLDEVPDEADLHITAFGIHRAWINGRRIGDHVLAPGWQTYAHRHFVEAFDVGDLLVAGQNALAIEVAEGWYRGRLGFNGGHRANYGDTIGPVAAIVTGDRTLVATDEAWRAAPSATTFASLYDGQRYDQRLDDDWTAVDYDDSGWVAAAVVSSDRSALIPRAAPPVRRIDHVDAVEITSSPAGKTLVDFGQNLVGWLRVRLPAVPDATITLRHAEVLEHGELGTRPLRVAEATDVIHTSGVGGEWEPEFTFHGFRYVEVDGWPGELALDDLTAVVIHTDMAEIGTFECSDARLNQLHSNARWGAKGNFVSVPTDCPQRDERLGWTGDLQVFAPAASFLFDCRDFLRSWLADLAADQAEAGGVVPMIVPSLPEVTPLIGFAGWADAAVVVPWVLYERFGDREVLETQWDSMVAWVDKVAELAASNGADGLWRGFQLGDWLDPSAPPENAAKGRTDATMVGDAYQVHVVRLLSGIAEALARGPEAAEYAERADRLAAAFRAEYTTPNGRVMSDSPAAYALALTFDLLTAEQRPTAEERLVTLVRADGWKVGTGFLGTPVICDALVAAGAPDDAFALLTQTECPSWLYAVEMGATTIWERWDSMLPDGSINTGEMTSFNHYAFGAIVDFMHRRVAGLAPGAPGYEVIEVAPLVGGGIEWAAATHVTPFGETAVRWERTGDDFSLSLDVPAGATARVRLPDGSDASEVAEGHHEFACRL